jgi:hypothetical protein
MPKVRDLGIHVMPAGKPEIGPGDGAMTPMLACPSQTCVNDSLNHICTPPTAVECMPHSEAEELPHCAEKSDCTEHSHPGSDTYKAGAFTPDAIAQLRQQLRDQIGNQPVN